jgi:hypothetical protein
VSGGNITREDIRHEDIVDAVEQASDGLTSIIFTGKTIVSTTGATTTVVLSGVDLLRDPEILENLDIVILAGTTGADGTYTVNQRIDGTSFTVNETIADSTGGTCEAQNPSGARKTGLDPTNVSGVTAKNMQTAMEELSSATGADDKKVQVNAVDASFDYLLAKLQAGTGISLAAVDIGGGVLQVKIDATGGVADSAWRRHFLLMGA